MIRLFLTLAAATASCSPPASCVEDIRAQHLDERVTVAVGELELAAELADQQSERERGWMHRRCDLEALLLIPEAAGDELPVWGCAVTTALDVVFVRKNEVVAVDHLDPCSEPCGACPRVGTGVPVDAVLEVPHGEYAIEVGARVTW